MTALTVDTPKTGWKKEKFKMIIELAWDGSDFKAGIREQVERYKLTPEAGRVLVGIEMYPPDAKDIWDDAGSLMDAILSIGLISQPDMIDRIVIDRRQSIKGGKCRVFVSTSHSQPEQDK